VLGGFVYDEGCQDYSLSGVSPDFFAGGPSDKSRSRMESSLFQLGCVLIVPGWMFQHAARALLQGLKGNGVGPQAFAQSLAKKTRKLDVRNPPFFQAPSSLLPLL
jgi:hypothetical protein